MYVFSARPATVYCVLCGPGRQGCRAWYQFSRLCWWHSALCSLSTWGNCRNYSQTRTLHHRHGQYWMSANRLKLNMDKTELLWAGTRYNMSMMNNSGPSLQLNHVTVHASQHVCVLGVFLQIWVWTNTFPVSARPARLLLSSSSTQTHPRRSLDADSAATLVHALVTSRVDYCNAILAAAPKTTTDRLQRVLNAAARVDSDTKKFDQGLSRLMACTRSYTGWTFPSE